MFLFFPNERCYSVQASWMMRDDYTSYMTSESAAPRWRKSEIHAVNCNRALERESSIKPFVAWEQPVEGKNEWLKGRVVRGSL